MEKHAKQSKWTQQQRTPQRVSVGGRFGNFSVFPSPKKTRLGSETRSDIDEASLLCLAPDSDLASLPPTRLQSQGETTTASSPKTPLRFAPSLSSLVANELDSRPDGVFDHDDVFEPVDGAVEEDDLSSPSGRESSGVFSGEATSNAGDHPGVEEGRAISPPAVAGPSAEQAPPPSEDSSPISHCLQFVGTLVSEEGDAVTPPPPSRQTIPLSDADARKLTLGQLVFHTTAETEPTPKYIYVYMVAEESGNDGVSVAASLPDL